ncbi:MalM family protein [Psychromonas sp. KJ10-10]|uniref:MalM family protein n=1 Tax=Psychromonas sp. KJ10-10 TaxID=3391823 RepID=UPI0039B3B31B
MNIKNSLTALLTAILLSACSSVELPSKSISSIDTSEVCCDHFSQFPWIQLESEEDIEFKLATDSPIGRFSDGDSYFSAFKFSPRSMKVSLGLSSFMSNHSVLAPKLVTLNHDFEVVRSINLDEFSIATSSAFTASQFQLNIELDASKTPYFIIYTPESYLGKTIKVKHPARVRAEEFSEVMPMVTDPSYIYGRFGSLKLNIKTLSLKAQQLKTALGSKAILLPTSPQTIDTPVLPETELFYKQSMTDAIKNKEFDKALSLLEEAKKVGVKDAQSIFIKALETTNK